MVNLESYVFWVLVAAAVLGTIAWAWLLVRAFRESRVWGCCLLLLPPLALFFVLEGVAPFLNPAGMKRALARLSTLQDNELRIAGLGSMLVGVAILFLVR